MNNIAKKLKSLQNLIPNANKVSLQNSKELDHGFSITLLYYIQCSLQLHLKAFLVVDHCIFIGLRHAIRLE
jgi:hypothetical protein